MQDEDYRAYLRRQSYDDLLSIRSSLDKSSHPDRYAIVLEEIEARGKQPAPLPFRLEPMGKVSCIVAGSIAAAIGLFSVYGGWTHVGRIPGSSILRTEHPVYFWMAVSVWFGCSAYLVYSGFKKDKKMPGDHCPPNQNRNG